MHSIWDSVVHLIDAVCTPLMKNMHLPVVQVFYLSILIVNLLLLVLLQNLFIFHEDIEHCLKNV